MVVFDVMINTRCAHRTPVAFSVNNSCLGDCMSLQVAFLTDLEVGKDLLCTEVIFTS